MFPCKKCQMLRFASIVSTHERDREWLRSLMVSHAVNAHMVVNEL